MPIRRDRVSRPIFPTPPHLTNRVVIAFCIFVPPKRGDYGLGIVSNLFVAINQVLVRVRQNGLPWRQLKKKRSTTTERLELSREFRA